MYRLSRYHLCTFGSMKGQGRTAFSPPASTSLSSRARSKRSSEFLGQDYILIAFMPQTWLLNRNTVILLRRKIYYIKEIRSNIHKLKVQKRNSNAFILFILFIL